MEHNHTIHQTCHGDSEVYSLERGEERGRARVPSVPFCEAEASRARLRGEGGGGGNGKKSKAAINSQLEEERISRSVQISSSK